MNQAKSHFFQIYFPYCLKRLSDDTFIVLNRNYKPLGEISSTNVNYEEFSCFKLPCHWSSMALGLGSWLHAETADMIFLYDGNTSPFADSGFIPANWAHYEQKLAALASWYCATAHSELPESAQLAEAKAWWDQQSGLYLATRKLIEAYGFEYEAAVPPAQQIEKLETVAPDVAAFLRKQFPADRTHDEQLWDLSFLRPFSLT